MALKITYWTASRTNPNIAGGVVSSESLALTGASAQSGLTPASAVYVSISATEAAALDYSGADPTAVAGATGTSAYMAEGERMWFDAVAGYKVAGIQAS